MLKVRNKNDTRILIHNGDFIGGRNLLLDTANKSFTTNDSNGYSQSGDFEFSCLPSEFQGKTITISARFDVTNGVSIDGSSNHRMGWEMEVRYSDGTKKYVGVWMEFSNNPRTEHKRLSRTYTLDNKPVVGIFSPRIFHQYFSSESATVSEVKLEFGSVVTDWTPAPEDYS